MIDLADKSLLLKLTREPGLDMLLIKFPNGNTDEVEFADAPEWFRLRHANKMDVLLIEKALDECYNFYESEVLIANPREIKREYSHADPKV
jgi:hypothetical protein